MGLYSTNRLSNIAESDVAEVNNVAESVEELVLPEANDKFGDIMEFVVATYENDSRMFDSLIQLDFVEAANASVMNEADAAEAKDAQDDVKEKTIKEKIVDLISKAIAALKQAAANAIAKIIDLFKSDEKIVASYKDTLKIANMEGFPGIANFAMPKKSSYVELKAKEDKKNAVAKLEEFTSLIGSGKSREDIDAAFDAAKEEMKGASEEFVKKLKEESFNEKVDLWKPSNTDLDSITYGINNSKTYTDSIKTVASEAIAALKEMQAKLKLEKKEAEKGDATYIANKKYQIASATIRHFSSRFKAYNQVNNAIVAAYRKAFIICGRYAAKKAKGETVDTEEKAAQEAVTMYMLGESSDQYVMNCLSY